MTGNAVYPAFYLNHCNVDRIWEAWMVQRGRTYVPTQATPGAPEGHRLEDEITSFVSDATTTPAEMLDVREIYEYRRPPHLTASRSPSSVR